jgi:hypothetical protein
MALCSAGSTQQDTRCDVAHGLGLHNHPRALHNDLPARVQFSVALPRGVLLGEHGEAFA